VLLHDVISVFETAPGNRHRRNDAVILGHGYPLTNGTGCRLLVLGRIFRVDRAVGPAVRRYDRVQFPPLGLRERDSEAVVDLCRWSWATRPSRMPDRKEAPSTRTLCRLSCSDPVDTKKSRQRRLLSQSTSEASVSPD